MENVDPLVAYYLKGGSIKRGKIPLMPICYWKSDGHWVWQNPCNTYEIVSPWNLMAIDAYQKPSKCLNPYQNLHM
jgi:hypothetical protein